MYINNIDVRVCVGIAKYLIPTPAFSSTPFSLITPARVHATLALFHEQVFAGTIHHLTLFCNQIEHLGVLSFRTHKVFAKPRARLGAKNRRIEKRVTQ